MSYLTTTPELYNDANQEEDDPQEGHDIREDLQVGGHGIQAVLQVEGALLNLQGRVARVRSTMGAREVSRIVMAATIILALTMDTGCTLVIGR